MTSGSIEYSYQKLIQHKFPLTEEQIIQKTPLTHQDYKLFKTKFDSLVKIGALSPFPLSLKAFILYFKDKELKESNHNQEIITKWQSIQIFYNRDFIAKCPEYKAEVEKANETIKKRIEEQKAKQQTQQ